MLIYAFLGRSDVKYLTSADVKYFDVGRRQFFFRFFFSGFLCPRGPYMFACYYFIGRRFAKTEIYKIASVRMYVRHGKSQKPLQRFLRNLA